MKLKLIFVFFTILFFSCNLKKNSFMLSNPNVSYFEPYIINYIGNNQLCYYLADSPYLYIYDIQKEKNISKIDLTKDPRVLDSIPQFTVEGVGVVSSIGLRTFDYHNKDSIFLHFDHTNFIKLINANGKFIDKFIIDKPIGDDTNYELSSMHYKPIAFSNNKIIINKLLNNAESFLDFCKFPNIISLDIKSKEINNFGEFPEIYKNGNNWHIAGYNYAYALNNNKVVVSFPIDSNLYIYENGVFINKINCVSQYLKNYNFPKFDDSKRGDTEYKVKYVSEIGLYHSIFYLKSPAIFCRLVVHPQNYKNADGSINESNDKDFSIVRLDKDFNILDEKFFSGKEYDFSYTFYTDKDVYLKKQKTNENLHEYKKIDF